MTQQEIAELCVASLANVLRIAKERVKTDAKFSRLGLDSAMVVYVMMEIEEKLGLELSTDDFYDYPTIDESIPLPRRKARRRSPPDCDRQTIVADMEPFSSLVELLATRARSQPDERAYIFLSDRGAEEAVLTFRQLHDAAQRAGGAAARRRPARRARAAGVSARPRIPRRVFRMPDRRRHRGADDDAAPAKRARFKRRDHRQLRTGGRAHQCGVCDPSAICRRALRAKVCNGCRSISTPAGPRRADLPRAAAARHRLPAIHLGLDLRPQGRRRQPRQSAGQSGNDPLLRSATRSNRPTSTGCRSITTWD